MREMPTFGDNLRRVIERRGLKKQEVAAKASTDAATLSRWMTQDNVELHSLLRLAVALGCSVETLLTGVDAAYDAMMARTPAPDRLVELWTRVAQLSPTHAENVYRLLVGLAGDDRRDPPVAPASDQGTLPDPNLAAQ